MKAFKSHETAMITLQNHLVPDDAALLMSSNPIPAAPGENVDPCIYKGQLKNESSVTVALSGCPFSDNFEVGKIIH